MSSSCEEENIGLIEFFRNRLRRLILVDPLLNRLHFIEEDDKESIRAKLRNEGDLVAADQLINIILKGPRTEGWFRQLIDGLETVGCKNAANYINNSPPTPSLEAENDNCVRMIQLLQPTLETMKTRDVCISCHTMDILTDEDRENILAETDNYGEQRGARLLLKRVVRNEAGWYSTLLKALRKTDHFDLVKELQGEDLVDEEDSVSGKGDTPQALKDDKELADKHLKRNQAPLSQVEAPASFPESSRDSILDSFSSGVSMDLYSDFHQNETSHANESMDCSSTDGGDGGAVVETEAAMGATGGPDEGDIVLRDYQMEVARPALKGQNIIICLPTGSGKTRVAVYITKEHLDSRRRKEQPGKVVVLVNKVPLVEQHYSTEFGRFLRHQYKVERVSGDSQLKISFPEVVRKNDIIICTAQILENSFANAKKKDEDGISLSDITLMVIDECHHTQKGGVYNHIMIRYLRQKHRNALLLKEQKEPQPIPQILGLTASPGVGGAKTQQKAEEHILKICANLDAVTIKTKNLAEESKAPFKRIASADKRKEDPFGDVIKGVMEQIHAHVGLNSLCEFGTQNYEQWVVLTEQNAAKDENTKVRVCAEHLRQYNEALHQSNTIRMSDAFSFLDKYYNEERKKKYDPEEGESINITDTERFLFTLFKDKKEKLRELTKQAKYENNSLAKLREVILKEFTTRAEARGIIFTRTRLSAIALSQWIQENPKFEECGVRASHLIGGGDQSLVKPMTSAEQKDVLKKFRQGEINLLIATTVAEEGLDIKECNIVIRYCLVTNEIAMIQARGRGRAEDSSYTLVETEGSGVAERESVNEYREKMMSKGIARVVKLPKAEYDKKIKDFQLQVIMEKRVHAKKKKQRSMQQEEPSKVSFSCRHCNKAVCSGESIKVIENMHHVNVTPRFRDLFTVQENASLQERLLDYEANGVIACKDCGHKWGSMMLYKSIDVPCLHIKNFVVTYNSKNKVFSKWSELSIRFPAFDYAAHAVDLVDENLEEEEEEEDTM
ncbi:interferon-induced helicase C domain-containing protein 1 isoform X1 [Alosa pseudoharengus]|uniref:interferon-induced helicase C domain-containing protein 1 isoform X1 n=1 Tax=Alosa pseudoharengus TaxID=34774 RepID=UPI003F8C41C9